MTSAQHSHKRMRVEQLAARPAIIIASLADLLESRLPIERDRAVACPHFEMDFRNSPRFAVGDDRAQQRPADAAPASCRIDREQIGTASCRERVCQYV